MTPESHRFPRDGRAWFRVADDILDCEKLNDLSAQAFRTYFRLLALLSRLSKSGDSKGAKQARQGKVWLRSETARELVDSYKFSHAWKVFEDLERRKLIRLGKRTRRQWSDNAGTMRVIVVPNFAKMQGFVPR